MSGAQQERKSEETTQGTGGSRKRVLLVAYACSPYRGSEPGVGWNWVREIGKYCDVRVIVKQQQYEEEIRRYLAETKELPHVRFHFVPRTGFEKMIKQVPGMFHLAYHLWHRRAFRLAAHLEETEGFDLVHLVNIGSFREPGCLFRLDAPFIWGPVGGTQNYPWRFLPSAGVSGAIREGVRSLVNIWQLRFSLRIREAVSKAALLLAANSVGMGDFGRIHHKSPVPMLDAGVQSVSPRRSVCDRSGDPLRILWSGVLDHHKALHLLLISLSTLPKSTRYKLRILGDGPLKKRWMRMARRLGVDHNCTWTGWITHEAAAAHYDWADLLVFTSLRDTSGNVVLEALSNGIPVICIDHHGAGDMVTEECGIKIPPTSPSRVTAGIRDAISLLARDRSKLEKLSRGANERAKEYLWWRKGEEMAEIYNRVIPFENSPHAKGEEKVAGVSESC
jgi:glycosyltransferase involved in cell wall biosynthesis